MLLCKVLVEKLCLVRCLVSELVLCLVVVKMMVCLSDVLCSR